MASWKLEDVQTTIRFPSCGPFAVILFFDLESVSQLDVGLSHATARVYCLLALAIGRLYCMTTKPKGTIFKAWLKRKKVVNKVLFSKRSLNSLVIVLEDSPLTHDKTSFARAFGRWQSPQPHQDIIHSYSLLLLLLLFLFFCVLSFLRFLGLISPFPYMP